MPYMNALHVCLTCMPYMYALYVRSLGKTNGPSSAFLLNVSEMSWTSHTVNISNVTAHGHGTWYLEVLNVSVDTISTKTVYAGAAVRGSGLGAAAYSVRLRVGRSDCLATFWTSGMPVYL